MWKFLIYVSVLISTVYGAGVIDLDCTDNDDCTSFVDDQTSSTCIDKQCQCLTIGLNTSIPCTPTSSRKSNAVGMKCPCDLIENSQCRPKENLCFCADNYVPDSAKRHCIKKKVQLGEDCQNDSQCLKNSPFSECDLKSKTCQCQKNFTQVNSACHSTARLDGKCESDSECQEQTKHSKCIKNTCLCVEGYVANHDKSECLTFATINETCVETNQCLYKLGSGSVCDSGKCVCDEYHTVIDVENDGKFSVECDRVRHFGDYCTDHNECRLRLEYPHPSMHCYLYECRCMDGFERQGTKCVLESSSSSNVNPNAMLAVLVAGLVVTRNAN